jgi:replication-associated recombination protein RarA
MTMTMTMTTVPNKATTKSHQKPHHERIRLHKQQQQELLPAFEKNTIIV